MVSIIIIKNNLYYYIMCEICKTNVPRTYFHSRSRIHKKKLFDRMRIKEKENYYFKYY